MMLNQDLSIRSVYRSLLARITIKILYPGKGNWVKSGGMGLRIACILLMISDADGVESRYSKVEGYNPNWVISCGIKTG